jgi:transformation/transcription domain-associated protein
MEPSVKLIIDAVLDVEEGVRRTRSSTFRATLYKYWNRCPQEVCSLLLGKIEEQKYGRFLAQILEHPESGPLRKVIVKNVEMLIKNSRDMGAEKDTRYTAVINSIHIMHSLCKFKGDREWMDKKDIFIWFNMAGKNLEAHLRTNTLPPHLRLAAEQASEQLMVIFTKFLEYHPTDLDALFSLIEFVTNEDFRQTQPLFTYIYHHIICNNSIEFWKTIVMWSMEVYASKSASQKTKAFLIHNIVNPIFAMNVMRNSKQTSPKGPQLMDKDVIESIHTKIWKVSLGNSNDDLTQPGIDHTRMGVLQLTAMLVKYYHSILYDMRQDIIKFGLTYICLEDIISKHAANVVIGYCIAHFETPAKIVRQVYISLLESSHDEGPALVTQALELIAPVLPKLCNAVPDDRNPIWAAAPRRILIEDRQNVQQITTVFYFLVKHADFFYEYRDKFIILIVKSLRTIAQLPNPSNQSMKLVLQLMTLVWQWEQQRVEGKKFLSTEKRKFEDSGEQLITSSPLSMISSTSADKSEYKIPTWARAEMISYLAEFIVSLKKNPRLSANAKAATASHPPIPPIPSVERINSMSLLHSLLHPQYWGDLDIDLSNIIEIMLAGEPTDNNWVNSMINALQVVRIIVDVKPDILKNMPLLEKLLERSLKSDNSEICACLCDETEIDGLKMKSLLERWSVS